jgi:hypothetical protein
MCGLDVTSEGQRRGGERRMGDTTDQRTGSRFDRLGPGDLTMLLTDRGQVPMNTGAILVFDAAHGSDASALRTVLADRVTSWSTRPAARSGHWSSSCTTCWPMASAVSPCCARWRTPGWTRRAAGSHNPDRRTGRSPWMPPANGRDRSRPSALRSASDWTGLKSSAPHEHTLTRPVGPRSRVRRQADDASERSRFPSPTWSRQRMPLGGRSTTSCSRPSPGLCWAC